MSLQLSYERYHRQIILKDFGEPAQQKLLQSKVLVIGAGGLGCPALQYLAAAGVGTIGIVDDDVVSLSNLHRQILYNSMDIGLPKTERAARVLQMLNPEIKIVSYIQRLTNKNAIAIIEGFDIIIDGTDNFATRYLVNDACVLLKKPLVYGAISQFEGQVAIFNCDLVNGGTAVNYRDLFPQPPLNGEVQNCAEVGVLGVLTGIIGAMLANETIKLVTGLGNTLVNRLYTYNALTNKSFEWDLSAKKETRSLIPADSAALQITDYVGLCCSSEQQFEIDIPGFERLLETGHLDVIDVRDWNETPVVTEFQHLSIPLEGLPARLSAIQSDVIVVFCQSGQRSLQAAKSLFDIFGASRKIYSLQGGIVNWKKHRQKI